MRFDDSTRVELLKLVDVVDVVVVQDLGIPIIYISPILKPHHPNRFGTRTLMKWTKQIVLLFSGAQGLAHILPHAGIQRVKIEGLRLILEDFVCAWAGSVIVRKGGDREASKALAKSHNIKKQRKKRATAPNNQK